MNRILFVDDEQRILDGLRDLLRKERKRWDMTFALGGEVAILALESESFDVVVSDMRMPKVDGAMVLESAKRLWPQAGRIILSGQTELAAATRMVPVAHQFLTKPCDGETLKAVIERVLDLTALIKDPRLLRLVGGTDTLPSPPRIYAELIKTLNEANSTTKDVAIILSSDPALSAKLLQLTNSAFFGLKRRVSSIETAVTLLGIETLRGLTLALGAFGSLTENGSTHEIAPMQEHAVLAGDIARIVSENNGDRDAIFAAALMHDVGRLLLVTRLPDLYAQVEHLRHSESKSICEAETAVLGVTHAEVGAYLLGLWGLPADIVEAVRYHHTPWRAPATNRIAKLVGSASTLADIMTFGDGESTPAELADDPIFLGAKERWHMALAAREAA